MEATSRKFLSVIATAALTLVVGCGIDNSIAPPPQASSAFSSAPDVTAATSADDAAAREAKKRRHDELIARRDSIRKATKETKDALKNQLDAARLTWKLFKKELNVAKKTGAALDLLRCEPLEYAADAEVIGPKGGSLKIGPHELVIPEGALEEEQLIVGTSPMGELVQVNFGPHGLQFLHSAKLTLSYGHCYIPPQLKLQLAYVDGSLRILELPPSKDKNGLKEVVGWIDHFSGYMIAY